MTVALSGTAVEVEGSGVAAACCVRLLLAADITCSHAGGSRPSARAVLLGTATQQLLRELFPDVPGLFDGMHVIRRRIVRWGAAKVVDLPHVGIVADERVLLNRLWQAIADASAPDGIDPDDAARLRILTTSGRAVSGELRCGIAEAALVRVRLDATVAADACWAESTTNGWLFLLSTGMAEATLIGRGAPLEVLLEESRLVAPCVAEQIGEPQYAAAYPRLSPPLAGNGFLACGSAAMAFDPLCGEGTGNAVREALLAVAAARRLETGDAPEPLRAHYSTRLSQGFYRHLEQCVAFYSSGGDGAFWAEELARLRDGMQAVAKSLAQQPPPLYRLVDRELIPL